MTSHATFHRHCIWDPSIVGSTSNAYSPQSHTHTPQCYTPQSHTAHFTHHRTTLHRATLHIPHTVRTLILHHIATHTPHHTTQHRTTPHNTTQHRTTPHHTTPQQYSHVVSSRFSQTYSPVAPGDVSIITGKMLRWGGSAQGLGLASWAGHRVRLCCGHSH